MIDRELNTNSEYGFNTWEEIDQYEGNGIVVIPTGAIEVYGPHLPLGSDSLVAENMARRVAARIDAKCLPLIPIGYSADLMSFPGTLTVEPEAFKAYLDGVCRSLIRWGFNQFLFLNTHLGNVRLIDQVADGLLADPSIRCLQIDFWRLAARLGADLWESGDWAVGHAGELGTSVLQFMAPELVRSERQVDFIPESNPWPAGVDNYKPYRQLTASSVMGRPSVANSEKGRLVVERSVDEIVTLSSGVFAS
jgi:creatinine amidohydrolase